MVYCGSLQSIACYIFLNCEILHYLLPAKRDTELISRLRSTKIFPTVRARTSRLKNSSIRTGQFSAPLVVLTSNVWCVCIVCLKPVSWLPYSNKTVVRSFVRSSAGLDDRVVPRTHSLQLTLRSFTDSPPSLEFIFDDLEWPLTPISRSRYFWSRISEKRSVLKTKLLLHKRKLYLTYGMVLWLVTLTDL